MSNLSASGKIVETTLAWVKSVVVDLDLCPFANRVLNTPRLRCVASAAITEGELLEDLQNECNILDGDHSIETTLLIHPHVLQDFYAYNEFLGTIDDLLQQTGREGVYQVASFHPEYQFSGTDAGDVENYTNRSPFPMLHLLREGVLEKAIASYADVQQIPEKNIVTMNKLGIDHILALLHAVTTEYADSDTEKKP